MPQLTLQYTANIHQDVHFKDIFSTFHQILADTGGIKIDNCKSRAIRLDNYYIGRGEPGNAFIHLDVRFLAGRPAALKKEIGKQMLDFLEDTYAPAMTRYNLQITVEIGDIHGEFYFKFPAGSFTNQTDLK